mmetsp:Transcript_21708/g.37034  ORF Transcript_21708/g.37034 Transcript_21708/m.37034 type:complete len:182 (+) Transcript_21708:58-603(+)
MNNERRKLPNILITGTPGTGKTTLAQKICEEIQDLHYFNVGQVCKDKGLHEGMDEEFNSLIPDEDKIVDELDPQMSLNDGGNVVDYHDCDFFPERWFDRVIVLRTDNTLLFDRLVARGYAENKVQENIECEIMQVLLDQARDSYANEIVTELTSDTVDDMDRNIDLVAQYVEAWKKENNNL